MELVYHPNELLETKCEHFDLDNPTVDLLQLKKDMFEMMKKHGGIGIAAPQVGLNYRIFCMQNNATNNLNERQMMAINPEVVNADFPEVAMYESCLSVPGLVLNVMRPHKIEARWYNENGKKREETLTGYSARVFLHELDHLDGIMMMDRVSPLELKKAQEELEHRTQSEKA